MAEIIEEKLVTKQSLIVGRECDQCKFQERSDRTAIVFDHRSDYKWAKVQLCLVDYTQPSNNRHFDLCSSDCVRSFSLEMASVWKDAGDCLGGIPLRYLEKLYV